MKLGLYYLKGDLTDKWPFTISRVELNGADPRLVYGLKKIGNWDTRIKFYYSKYDIWADFQIPMVCPLHFVTLSFINSLSEDQLRCVNFIPITIYPEKNGPLFNSYSIVDYVYSIEALNTSLSNIIYDKNREKEIVTVPNRILDKNKIFPNIQIFRLKESPTDIVVSQQVVDNLDGNFITGTRFVNVAF
jgi:hypothetical protein